MNTRTHGILDYIVGALLIASPWLFGFADIEAARWTAVVIGAANLVYSMLTDYELGVARVIPMGTHLGLDFVSGAVLALSPWLFGFSEFVYLPHLLVGLLEIGSAAMTRRHPTRHRAVA